MKGKEAKDVRRNWDRVSDGFDILHPVLVKFVVFELSAAYGDGWWDAGVDPVLTEDQRGDFEGRDTNRERIFDNLSLSICLEIIDCNWSKIFSNELPRACYPLVIELEVVCDEFARRGGADCSAGDAHRWLDTMQRLCEAVDDNPDSGRADKIRALMDDTLAGNDDNASALEQKRAEAALYRGAFTSSIEIDEKDSGSGRDIAEQAQPVQNDSKGEDEYSGALAASAPAPDSFKSHGELNGNVEGEGAKATFTRAAEIPAANVQTSDKNLADRSRRATEEDPLKSAEGKDGFTCYAEHLSTGVRAQGVFHYPECTLMVLPGSQVDVRNASSSRTGNETRRELIESGELVEGVDGVYKLKRAVTFNSPSAAGAFVFGGTCSGWSEWKGPDGRKLKELFPDQGKAFSTSGKEKTVTVFSIDQSLGMNCKAVYHHPSGKMDVLAGSYVRIAETGSLSKAARELRAGLVASGDLVARDDRLYVLKRKVSFSSPTAAAQFVLGSAASGPRKWADFHGTTLGELFPKQKTTGESKETSKSASKKSTEVAKKSTISANGAEGGIQGNAAKTKDKVSSGRAATTAKDEVTLTVYAVHSSLGRNCRAVFHYPSGKMDVLEGSWVRTAESDSLPKSTKELRAKLVASGDLVERNSMVCVLKRQVSVNSPTAAAQFVLGASASGPKEWRDVQTDLRLEKLFPKRGSVSSAKENAKPAAKTSTSSSRRTVSSASRTRNSPAKKSATTDPTSVRGASSSGSNKNTTVKLYADIPGCTKRAMAIFYPNSKWMDVLGGSFVRIATFDSLPRDVKERREKLLASGDLVAQDDQVYALKKVVSFSSSSAAAEFVLGTSASGPREWKDSRGVELGDLYPELFRRRGRSS